MIPVIVFGVFVNEPTPVSPPAEGRFCPEIDIQTPLHGRGNRHLCRKGWVKFDLGMVNLAEILIRI